MEARETGRRRLCVERDARPVGRREQASSAAVRWGLLVVIVLPAPAEPEVIAVYSVLP